MRVKWIVEASGYEDKDVQRNSKNIADASVGSVRKCKMTIPSHPKTPKKI